MINYAHSDATIPKIPLSLLVYIKTNVNECLLCIHEYKHDLTSYPSPFEGNYAKGPCFHCVRMREIISLKVSRIFCIYMYEVSFYPGMFGNYVHAHAVETKPFLLLSNGPGYEAI